MLPGEFVTHVPGSDPVPVIRKHPARSSLQWVSWTYLDVRRVHVGPRLSRLRGPWVDVRDRFSPKGLRQLGLAQSDTAAARPRIHG